MEVRDYSENYGNGWVKLYRSLKEKSWFKKAEHLQLWIYLLIDANHKGKEGIFFGEPIKLEPGQTLTGRKKIAESTGISESKVERLLNYFEKKERQIEQQKSNKNRIITIVNWHLYQNSEQQPNNNRTTTEQQLDTNKNVKNDKKEKKEDIYISLAEEIYNEYKTKIKAGGSFDAKNSIIKLLKNKVTKEELIQSINNYKESLFILETEHRYFYQANNFFGKKSYWADFAPENYERPISTKTTNKEMSVIEKNRITLRKMGWTEDQIRKAESGEAYDA